MAGEIRQGKRTLIEHNGREFELPHQHTVELREVELEEGNQTWVNLSTPLEARPSISASWKSDMTQWSCISAESWGVMGRRGWERRSLRLAATRFRHDGRAGRRSARRFTPSQTAARARA
jgi:hypothetical protein